jgi:hypothetical protein
VQAGVDVSKHGGHAYPGMEDVYNVELQHMASDDVMTDVPDHKFHGSSGVDYPGSHSSKLQSQVGFSHPFSPFSVKLPALNPGPRLFFYLQATFTGQVSSSFHCEMPV